MDKTCHQPSDWDMKPSARPSRQHSAFSLLELLVVIAIMGIVAGMTLAIGPGFLRSTALSSSLSNVASAVSLARSEAIRSRKQTYFVLAPESPLDERSFTAYAVVRKEDGANFRYVAPWKKLPTGVLFRPDAATNNLPTADIPYPRETDSAMRLRAISFVSDGSLDEDLHAKKPSLPLQAGTRTSATAGPEYQGDYTTNEIFVERMSGKVKVVRVGDVPK